MGDRPDMDRALKPSTKLAMPMDKSDELRWGMYQEHVTQARQHENQRERMTALIVAIAAAALAFIGQSGLKWGDLLLSVPLVALGIFGKKFSTKHYERNRMHVAIAAAYLTEVDASIYTARTSAIDSHKKSYGETFEEHLHLYWERIHVAIAILGLIVSGWIVAAEIARAQGESMTLEQVLGVASVVGALGAAVMAWRATAQASAFQKRTWKIDMFNHRLAVYLEMRRTLDDLAGPGDGPHVRFAEWLETRQRALKPARFLFSSQAGKLADDIVRWCERRHAAWERSRREGGGDLNGELAELEKERVDLYSQVDGVLGGDLNLV